MRGHSRRGSRLKSRLRTMCEKYKVTELGKIFKIANYKCFQQRKHWSRKQMGTHWGCCRMRTRDPFHLWESMIFLREHCRECQHARVKGTKARDSATCRALLRGLLGNPYPGPSGGLANSKAEECNRNIKPGSRLLIYLHIPQLKFKWDKICKVSEY